MRLKLCPLCKEALIADIFVVYFCDACQALANEDWQQLLLLQEEENDRLQEEVEKKYGVE